MLTSLLAAPGIKTGAKVSQTSLWLGRLFATSLLVLSLIVLMPVSPLQAAGSPDFSAVEAYIQQQMATEGFPGLAVAIVQNGQIIYLKGFGVTSLNDPKPVTPLTLFDLASSTKSFTAMGILLLADKGMVNLDDPLVEYVPDFRLADVEASSHITIRQLLNQTSGIPGGVSEPAAFYNGPEAMEELLVGLTSVPLSHLPGEAFEYSNTNFCLLGLLVERVTGQVFEDYMQENIFTPLGLAHTTLWPEVAESLDRAHGHQPVYGQLMTRDIPAIESAKAAGWIMSSAQDMAKWLILQLNKGVYDGQQLLPAADIAAAQQPEVYYQDNGKRIGYGMGWFSGVSEEGWPIIWHGGDTPNFMSDMLLVPGQDFGVVVLANAQSTSVGHVIAPGIANILLGMTLKWWSYWKTADTLATGGLWLCLGLVAALGAFGWYLGRALKQRRYTITWPWRHTGRPPFVTVLYITPLILVLLLATIGYFLIKFFWGWDMYRVLVGFRDVSPPGVWISGTTLLILLAVWGTVLSFVALFTRLKAKNGLIPKSDFLRSPRPKFNRW
jgi:CubicO group peptidase (beta-lactamase class C family)